MTKPRNIRSIETATGIPWDEWRYVLRGCETKSHAVIVATAQAYLREKTALENAGWWAQSVAVAFEQATGRRLPGQQLNGTFEITVNKTIKNERKIVIQFVEKWMEKQLNINQRTKLNVRRSDTPIRSYWRCDLNDGTKIVVATGPNGHSSDSCLLTISHTKISSPKHADLWRSYWREQIATMKP